MNALNTLESQAEALKAINSAKHKSAGKTHRAEIQVFTARGKYVKTVVFYTVGAPVVAKLAVQAGTKSISDSLLSAQIQEL